MLQVFYLDVAYVCNCFSSVFHVFQEHVSNVSVVSYVCRGEWHGRPNVEGRSGRMGASAADDDMARLCNKHTTIQMSVRFS